MNIYSLSIESIESIEFLRVTPGDPVAHHKPDGSHTPSLNGKILIVFGGGVVVVVVIVVVVVVVVVVQ